MAQPVLAPLRQKTHRAVFRKIPIGISGVAEMGIEQQWSFL
jgi:hypothetical protein